MEAMVLLSNCRAHNNPGAYENRPFNQCLMVANNEPITCNETRFYLCRTYVFESLFDVARRGFRAFPTNRKSADASRLQFWIYRNEDTDINQKSDILRVSLGVVQWRVRGQLPGSGILSRNAPDFFQNGSTSRSTHVEKTPAFETHFKNNSKHKKPPCCAPLQR